MLPLLMMRHRRISHRDWRDHQTPNGKHWIEQVCTSRTVLTITSIHLGPAQDLDESAPVPPDRTRTMIGYHLAWDYNIIAMSMTQGRQRDVVYLGMAVKRLRVDPPQTSVLTYVQSFYHKVSAGNMYTGGTCLSLTSDLVDRARGIVHRAGKP